MNFLHALWGRIARTAPSLLALAALFCVTTTAKAQIFSIFDSQGVSYDIIRGTHNVIVSADNATIFSTQKKAITIPSTVINDSDNQTEGESNEYTVVGIAPKAFASTQITAFTLTAELEEIPDDCFNACWSLTSVSLPSSITKIGNKAFYDCFNLVTMSLPLDITSIGEYSFYNLKKWTGTISGTTKYVSLKKVTSVPERAFSACKLITTFYFGPDLKTIDDYAFYGCSALKTLSLGTTSTLESIGDYAFQNCTAMSFPTIPNTCTYWGVGSFKGCTSFTTVTIPQQVRMGGHNFEGAKVTKITWPADSIDLGTGQTFLSATGLTTNVPVPAWMTHLTDIFAKSSVQTFKFEEGLEMIETNALTDMASLTGLVFPKGFKRLPLGAVKNCAKLATITFTEGMTVETNAFQHCAAIATVNFPANPMTLEPYPFGNFSAEFHAGTSVTIPGWMTEIPEGLMYNFNKLANITIPEGVTKIGDYAFYQHYATTLTFPSTLTWIGDYAFYQVWVNTLTSLNFPEPLYHIGRQAFNCHAIPELTIPATLLEYDEAFEGGVALKTITFEEGQTKVCDGAFLGCGPLTTINLASTITEIGNRAFQGCSQLVGPTSWPAGLTRIGSRAFQLCSSFYKNTTGYYKLPGGCTYGDHAFFRAQINGIEFPEEECEVGEATFMAADIYRIKSGGEVGALPAWMDTVPNYLFATNPFQTLVMGGNVKHVGDYAFAMVSEYENIYFNYGIHHGRRNTVLPTSPCTWGHDVFYNCSFHVINFPDWMTEVPEGFVASSTDYILPEGESTNHVIPCINWNNIERIGDRAFYSQVVGNFNLSDKIKYIGKEAFRKAYVCWDMDFLFKDDKKPDNWEDDYILQLKNPDGVEIGQDAFTEATIREAWIGSCGDFSQEGVFTKVSRLKKVTLPDCMTEIPPRLFYQCNGLEDVKISPNLVSIGDEAFAGCDSLRTLVLPETLNYIGRDALALGKHPTSLFGVTYNTGEFFTELKFPTRKIAYIHPDAFQGMPVEELEIPAWMDNVPNFRTFTSLKSVTWADRSARTDCDSIVGIGFPGCTSLENLHIPENIPVGLASGAGFEDCTSLREITGGNQIYSLADKCFKNCRELTAVPDLNDIPVISDECFYGTAKLYDLEIGENVVSVGRNAFLESGVKVFHLTDKCKNLSEHCFAGSAFDEITIPGAIKALPEGCFDGSSTKNVIIEEGLEDLGKETFKSAKGLVSISLPSTVNKIPEGAFKASTVEKVYSASNELNIDNEGLYDCQKLQEFRVKGRVANIGFKAFQNCINLTDFVMESGESVDFIDTDGFAYCSSLTRFPYLKKADMRTRTFYSCKSLSEITLPEEGNFLERSKIAISTDVNTLGSILAYSSNLQSITWPDDNHYFFIHYNCIEGCPLQALSYVYDTQLVPYDPFAENPNPSGTLAKFIRSEYNWAAGTNASSPLMVRRNQKWKFHEANYTPFFDIREMKEPQINLTGYIWSKYNNQNNTNHYRVNLMWDVALSDLNDEGETEFSIYRDEEKVAILQFKKPNFEATHPDLGDVIEVDVVVMDPDRNIVTNNSFQGDFDFPIEVEGDTIYQATKGFQWNQLHFDRTTHKRLATFDKYGYYPWFIYVDEFDSETLSEKDAPAFYTYQVKMNSYAYKKPVNNVNCELDAETGLRYHYVDTITGDIVSAKARLYPMMSMPSLEFEGLYSEADIRADRFLSGEDALKPTTPDYVNSFGISYKVDPKIAKMKGRLPDGEIIPMVEWVEVHEVRTDDDGKDYTVPVTEQFPVDYGTDFVAALPEDLELNPYKRYITVTGSTFRGQTGSLVMSVPNLLTLESSIEEHQWSGHNHDGNSANMHSTVLITPDVSKMGYGDTPLKATDYYVGIWRHFIPKGSTVSLAPLREDAALTDGVLIHHCGEELSAATCDDCASRLVHNADGTITYHDYFDVDFNSSYDIAYTTRAYVKVPESVIPGEARYMLAQYTPSTQGEVLSGVEDVTVDNEEDATMDETDYRYFDLQGHAIPAPIPGQPCIRVTPSGAKKIIK